MAGSLKASGSSAPTAHPGMPRFVILRHEPGPQSDRPLHWDLMLEMGDSLKTWSLPVQPDQVTTMVAVALPDHRKAYLQFEGPVSRGRGYVTRFDEGWYEHEVCSAVQYRLKLVGVHVPPHVTLTHCESDSDYWDVRFEDRSSHGE